MIHQLESHSIGLRAQPSHNKRRTNTPECGDPQQNFYQNSFATTSKSSDLIQKMTDICYCLNLTSIVFGGNALHAIARYDENGALG